MLNPLVFAALVALLKAIADAYLPQFPISEELIYTLVLALLALFGVGVGVRSVERFAPRYRGLFKD